MRNFHSIQEVLDFAISKEIEASNFYKRLSQIVEKPEIQKKLSAFALEEFQHKLKLETVRDGDGMLSHEDVGSLDIADYLDDVEPSADMSYTDALAIAMKREKAAFKLYSDLATIAKHEKAKEIFLLLAQEEAKHKLHLEVEYDLAIF